MKSITKQMNEKGWKVGLSIVSKKDKTLVYYIKSMTDAVIQLDGIKIHPLKDAAAAVEVTPKALPNGYVAWKGKACKQIEIQDWTSCNPMENKAWATAALKAAATIAIRNVCSMYAMGHHHLTFWSHPEIIICNTSTLTKLYGVKTGQTLQNNTNDTNDIKVMKCTSSQPPLQLHQAQQANGVKIQR